MKAASFRRCNLAVHRADLDDVEPSMKAASFRRCNQMPVTEQKAAGRPQ